ncbi:probable glutamine--tRNA ligase isoform X1 [Macrobrachium nipponense]|uniref:probable glutamine--tRNA ligase isoform X1 n=1 Tax=Macrobrachium nipponense TaxID=159736 RepID=UPI0030C7A6E2
MDISAKLSLLGLSDTKVNETIKNKPLSALLAGIVDEAKGKGDITKPVGNLLYHLGTKLPQQFHKHIPLLVAYLVDGRINQEAKLTAAIKFVQNSVSGNINIEEFEKSCGVGVEVSQDEIEASVAHIIGKHKEALLSQRYRFNVGPLIGQVRASLPWADSKKVKEEIDLQVLTLLGPKGEEDLVKPPKVKNAEKKEKADKVDSAPQEKQCLTMTELLRTVQFHAPGENHKTDGYIITDQTERLLKEHLKVTGGQVRTRFPPEPNGILHIGHAKAININFGYAAANGGVCFLRYDDTNPEKEEEKFFKGIKEMVEWLGYKPYKITHSSDYFHQLYEWAKLLIEKNMAYVCHQKAEELKGFNPKPSPWRERPVEESRQLFEDMKNGKFDEGEATLRLKLTLEEGKLDPVAYRIKYFPHHCTGNEWCIYPTYDYTHCLCDSLENITHSLCTKEFQSRRSSYYWLCNAVETYSPVQWEYGRLNMNCTVVSKRKIAKLISEGHVRDWDDPRLFTLTALRRRGFPAEAINSFCATLGLTGAQISIHPRALEACVRRVLNMTARRVMVVMDPMKVVITNYPNNGPVMLDVPNIPGLDEEGSHSIPFDKELWLERSDFRETADGDYRGLTPEQSVGLKYSGFIIKLQEVVRTPSGEVDYLKVTCEAVSEENKPKSFIHWVAHPVKCEVRLYEQLFIHEFPEDPAVVPGGYLTDINPNSLTIKVAFADCSVKGAEAYQKFQFQRVGFFCVDPDSMPDYLVFNRTCEIKADKGKN